MLGGESDRKGNYRSDEEQIHVGTLHYHSEATIWF